MRKTTALLCIAFIVSFIMDEAVVLRAPCDVIISIGASP